MMSTQVTVTISDELYQRAQKVARIHQRDVAEILAEAIVLEPDGGERVAGETAVDREEAAFYRLHPELWQKYPGQYVAIFQSKLIDHDEDQLVLFHRVKQKHPGEFVWIAPVREEPIEEYVMRSPRFVENVP
jgi:hypothetical protein